MEDYQQPRDWSPEPNVIYTCINCDALFSCPQLMIMFGTNLWACPECHEIEFFALANEVVWGLYWNVIGASYTTAERLKIRDIAEALMEPFDPSTRGF